MNPAFFCFLPMVVIVRGKFLFFWKLGLREKEKKLGLQKEKKTIVCAGSSNGNHHQRFCLDLASQGRLTA